MIAHIEMPKPRTSDCRTAGTVFLFAFVLCALITKSHVTGWNDGSRFATIDAITANHRFAIDGSPYAVGLGDEIRFRGVTYSDKPPLLPLLGAGVAALIAPLGITLRHAPGLAVYLIVLLTVGLAFAAGCTYAYAFARLLGAGMRLAVAVAALTGIGTLILPYATVLANHVPCGAAGLAGTYYLLRARDGSARLALGAGALFGLAYAFDAAGAVFAVTGLVLLWGRPLAYWLLAVAGGLPFLVLQLAYNLRISGSVMPTVFNARVWSDPSLPLHAWSTEVFAVYSPAAYARIVADLLIGTKGLFTYTPLMLVAAFGCAVMLRTPGTARRVAIAVVATAGVYFLLIVFLQNDAGASNFGERRYVDLFFLLCVPLGPALAAVRGAATALVVRIAIVASVAIAALGTLAPFGGVAGEWGFDFAGAAFAELARRSPLQAGLDVVLLLGLLGMLLRLVPLGVSPTTQPRG